MQSFLIMHTLYKLFFNDEKRKTRYKSVILTKVIVFNILRI